MKKPVILIIENSIDVTGAFIGATRAAEALRRDYEFRFILPEKSKAADWLQSHGFVTYFLPMIEIRRNILSLLLYIPCLFINAIRLNAIVKKEGIVIIHINDLYNLLPIALRLFNKRIPYVCHIRFLPDKFPKWLFSFWLKLHCQYAQRIITVSHYLHDLLPPHPKLVLIHNGIHFDERYPATIAGESKKVFLFLANFINGKGQNFAIEAFAQLHTTLPDWKLRFVGSDMGLKKNREYSARLVAMSKSLGVWEKIEWVGFTEDVEKEYKGADIVLNFSESESFSLTCAEALYFGKPVIATKCGGPSEIVDHLKSGLLVSNKATFEMAEAMHWLALRPKKRFDFGEFGKSKIRSVFTAAETARRISEVYLEVIKK
jgi:L-malate glycosyltransferase